MLPEHTGASGQQSLIARVKLHLVLENEVHEFIAADQPQVALASGEVACLVGEGAEGDEEAELGACHFPVQGGHNGSTDGPLGALDLNLDDWNKLFAEPIS